MIEHVRIEADESGWYLILDGDLSRECMEYVYAQDGALNVRLSDEAAAQLVGQVEPIREHLAEGEQHRRDYEAASDEERRHVLGIADQLDDDGFLHGNVFVMDGERIDPESARHAGDIIRKRDRENPPC